MFIFYFVYLDHKNLEHKELVLASDKSIAEMLLKKNRKVQKILLRSVLTKPTSYSVFSRNSNNQIVTLNYKDSKNNGGRISLWEKLPIEL